MNKYYCFLIVTVIMFCCLFTSPNPFLIPAANEIMQAVHFKRGACSAINLVNNGYSIFGANMDTNRLEDGMIVINKRGVIKTGLWPGTTGEIVKWTSKYASVTFNLVGFEMTWAGMNEKGLCVSTMALYDDTFSPPPDERPYLPDGYWWQHIMDTCETVQDIFTAFSKVRIVTRDHYLLADRYGNCATVEFLEDKMVVHTGDDLPVSALTNTPYSVVLQAWLEHKQSGGNNYLYRRFCTAADLVDSFQSTDHETAIQYAFDTLHSIKNFTQWHIVFDTKNLRAYFQTDSYPETRFVDLFKFDLSCEAGVKMLNIQADWPGDVSDHFTDFSYDLAFYVYRNFLMKYIGDESSDGAIHSWLRHFMNSPCSH